MTTVIDTHSHIHFPEYDADRGEVIARARAVGVKILAIGTNLQTSQDALRIRNLYSDDIMGVSAGLHPTYDEHFDEAAFSRLLAEPSVLGVGECGLDYYRIVNQESKIRQKENFEKQIELAAKFKKPLVIHCREAHADLLAILKANSHKLKADHAGAMHFFGGEGSWENADEYIKLGFYISLAGVITFKNYAHADNIRRLPLARLLVETDAPFVAPEPYRGKRNEPSYAVETVKKLAELKSVSYEKVAEATAQNAKTLFNRLVAK